MANWFLQTGIYLIGFALIFLGGLTLAYWGIWGNRSKGKPRCPRCWYDMRGSLPSMVCPECGHDALGERRLYRDHRRWWAIAVGLAMLFPPSYSMVVVYQWYREQPVITVLRSKFGQRVPPSRSPKWLVDCVPDRFSRYFERVDWHQFRSLHSDSATDEDLARLRKLRNLKELHLSGSDITDDGLASLNKLRSLEHLSLSNTDVSDAGLVHLKRLKRLRYLSLSGTSVNGNGLAYLPNLSNLRALYLFDCPVTDAGLAHLDGLVNLRNWISMVPMCRMRDSLILRNCRILNGWCLSTRAPPALVLLMWGN